MKVAFNIGQITPGTTIYMKWSKERDDYACCTPPEKRTEDWYMYPYGDYVFPLDFDFESEFEKICAQENRTYDGSAYLGIKAYFPIGQTYFEKYTNRDTKDEQANVYWVVETTPEELVAYIIDGHELGLEPSNNSSKPLDYYAY